jgi:hypothetical protein
MIDGSAVLGCHKKMPSVRIAVGLVGLAVLVQGCLAGATKAPVNTPTELALAPAPAPAAPVELAPAEAPPRVDDGDPRLSMANGPTRAAACANAQAGVSVNGTCNGTPLKREMGDCTCITSGSDLVSIFTCQVETKFTCAPPVEATKPAPLVAMSAPGGYADPACDASEPCKTVEKECNEGRAGSCVILAGLYTFGIQGVAKDPSKAAKLHETACESEPKAGGCAGLAALHLEGNGVPRNKARVQELAKRGCEADDPAGCALLCAVPKAKAQAVARLHAQCDGDDKVACTALTQPACK